MLHVQLHSLCSQKEKPPHCGNYSIIMPCNPILVHVNINEMHASGTDMGGGGGGGGGGSKGGRGKGEGGRVGITMHFSKS